MTRLDQLLDLVISGQRELTFDLTDAPTSTRERIVEACKLRGLDCAGTSRWLLVRAL